MKKKLRNLTITLLCLMVCLVSTGARYEEASLLIGNTELPAKGIVQNGRTLVPVRVVTEAMDAQVTWDGATQTVHIVREIPIIGSTMVEDGNYPIEGWAYYEVTFTIGSANFLYSNPDTTDAVGALDVPAQIINHKTMVPLRAACEYLYADVQWDGATSTATIDPSYVIEAKQKEYDRTDIAIAEREAIGEFTDKTLEPKALYITPYGCSKEVDILTWVGPAYGMPDNLNFIYSKHSKGAYFSETGSLTGAAGPSIYDVPDYPKGFTDSDDTGTFSDIRMMSLEGNVWLNRADLIQLGLLDK